MKRIAILLLTHMFLFVSSCSEDLYEDHDDCYEGYTGYDCEEQITPSKITITKVVVQRYPSSISDGLSLYPDIALKIYTDSDSYGPSNNYYEDASPWGSHDFYPNFKLYDAYDQIHVVLYDYDFLFGEIVDQDYMGGVQGVIYSNQNEFPSMVNFDYGSYEFDLYLSYQW